MLTPDADYVKYKELLLLEQVTPKVAERLHEKGISTIEQLAETDPKTLASYLQLLNSFDIMVKMSTIYAIYIVYILIYTVVFHFSIGCGNSS